MMRFAATDDELATVVVEGGRGWDDPRLLPSPECYNSFTRGLL